MSENHKRCCLSIAGIDPSGGAGIYADIKVFHQFGVFGAAAATMIAVQNSKGVSSVNLIDPSLFQDQLHAIFSDLEFDAVKLGALGSKKHIEVLAPFLTETSAKIICDPVLLSSSGSPLLETDAIHTLIDLVLPKCHMVTPNLDELLKLTADDRELSTEQAARRLLKTGLKYVLVTGGHLQGKPLDTLFSETTEDRFEMPRIDSKNTHGTGCALSSAVCAQLACGKETRDAVEIAKSFVYNAIASAPGLGSGVGPLNLLYEGPVVK